MKSIYAMVFLLILASACEKQIAESPQLPGNVEPITGCNEQPELCQLTSAANDFGFDLFRHLHEAAPEENLFISPHSIHTALSMTMNGAATQTLADMRDVLEVTNMGIDQQNDAYQLLLSNLPKFDPAVKLYPANAIWHRDDFQPEADFLAVNQEKYLSEVAALDFRNPEAVDIINGWISDHTEALIPEMLDKIPAEAVMYLINAIYFKGDWTRPFDPEFTEDRSFALADGSYIQTPTMNMGQVVMPYLQTEHFEAVDLAYGDSVVSMSLILPKAGVSMDQIVDQLDAENWSKWSSQFYNEEMFLSLPKFKMRWKAKLNDPLTDLGMGIIFDANRADFSGMNAEGGLYVSRVLHEAVVEVSEEGTEAAGATIVEVVETSVPLIPNMHFNRPFLFVIWEKKAGTVLFAGKLMNPKAD